jgi:hypothetical protein
MGSVGLLFFNWRESGTYWQRLWRPNQYFANYLLWWPAWYQVLVRMVVRAVVSSQAFDRYVYGGVKEDTSDAHSCSLDGHCFGPASSSNA